MASETLKRDIHLPQNKTFLWKLYELKSEDKKGLKELINQASAHQLILLIKVLHVLLNGHVPIKKIHFERIKWAKKWPLLTRSFESKAEYRKLKQSPAIVQRKVLLKITVYHELLFHLFNLP